MNYLGQQQGKNKFKCPEAGAYMAHLKNCKEASAAGMEKRKGD